MKRFFYLIDLFIVVGCSNSLVGTFKSFKLTSSRGESIFINSINWGATDDYQLSAISLDSLKLKEKRDSIGVVYGLNPFIFSFQNDSLNLYFYNKVTYHVIDKFRTISIGYNIVNANEFLRLNELALHNLGFYSVPITKNRVYPDDMPLPTR